MSVGPLLSLVDRLHSLLWCVLTMNELAIQGGERGKHIRVVLFVDDVHIRLDMGGEAVGVVEGSGSRGTSFQLTRPQCSAPKPCRPPKLELPHLKTVTDEAVAVAVVVAADPTPPEPPNAVAISPRPLRTHPHLL
jgi:hypothetical protein